MVAAINTDRTHLAEVQDRLIAIAARRREIALQFGAGIANEAVSAATTEEESVLAAEQGGLEDQEAEVRRALEDAGTPSPTVEDHARERLVMVQRLRGSVVSDYLEKHLEIERSGELRKGEAEEIKKAGDDLAAKEQALAAYLEAIDAAEENDPPGEEPAAYS